jgi:hypothetical protein
MPRIARKKAFAAAAIAATIAVPPAAQAAPSSVSIGFETNTTDSLEVSAAGDSATHEIAVTRSGGTAATERILVSDSAGVVGPAQCIQLSPTAISCAAVSPSTLPGTPTRAVAFVEVTGGEAADRIDFGLFENVGYGITAGGNGGNDSITGSSGPDGLFGGPGRDLIDGLAGEDRVSGQKGADRVTGGAGADEMRGGKGIDKLFARDGERDVHVGCGGGADRKERAFTDRSDPRSESC